MTSSNPGRRYYHQAFVDINLYSLHIKAVMPAAKNIATRNKPDIHAPHTMLLLGTDNASSKELPKNRSPHAVNEKVSTSVICQQKK